MNYMKKLFTLLTMLVLGIGSSWADGLKVSTTENANAEYQYKIFCRAASSYYLGNTTNATNSGTDYGLFAFFKDNSGDYTNGYYIYSILEGKWVTYAALASYSEGKNKISLSSEKPTVPWNIAADDTYNKYYDIRPFKTDKSVDNMSWNWHGGTSVNTSNTMGFYSYTDGSSGWGIVLAGGSGSPVADRKVVALFNVPSDNNEYPLYNSNGTAKVYSATTGQNPQYFVLRQNGLDNSGEALYQLQKAEGDGKYLSYNSFSTTGLNYLFLNTSSSFFSYYTYSSTATSAESPYYDFFRKWPNATDNSSRPYSNQVAQCNDGAVNMYSSDYNALPVPRGTKGNWNGRWKVAELAGYTAWQVVMSGATSGTVTYNGSALISGGTATQSNNGIFVISSASTPTSSDFTINNVDGYLTDPSISFDSDRKLIKVAYTNYSEIYNTITTKLSTAPEGVGYPTATARARMQAAIDVFDASSKATANLTTLNTAYNSFLTNVVLPEGKVYTIQSYIKSPSKTTYLKNENGTLTIGAEASATTLNNLWVVRKSGNNYVLQSASDPTKYIVYNSFTLAATGSTWTLSCGTEWPYISMNTNFANVGKRFVACNGSDKFGTASGSYYANDRTQTSGWSTDFKFVESEGYALYKVKIIYPSGSAPTVTYNETAYSNGADFVAPTTLESTDLIASSITGYTANISINNDIIYVNYTTAFDYADTWNFDNSPWSLLNDTPAEIDKPSRTYRFNTKKINVNTTFNCSIVVKFAYTSGSFRIDVAGVDLLDPSTGKVVRSDYHDGYSGNDQSNREYTIDNVAPGNYILRYISYAQSTSSEGNISVKITPVPGFYRIKGYSNNYMTFNTVGSNASMNGTLSINNIIYYSGDKNLIFFANGYGMYNTHTVAPVGSTLNKYSILPGAQSGKYYVKSDASGIGTYCYDNTSDGQKVDRNSDPVTSGSYQTDWTVEEVTSLPVTFKKKGLGYTTFFTPVALQIPAKTHAYVCQRNNETLTFYEITKITTKDGDNDVATIPANTAVLLYNEDAGTDGAPDLTTVSFKVTSCKDEGGNDIQINNNSLDGTLAAETMTTFRVVDEENYDIYSLRTSNSGKKVGFFKKTEGDCAGFKSWLRVEPTTGDARNFTIYFDGEEAPTGIVEALGLEHDNVEIYDLNGRKLSTYKKGINIVNGKKVMVQ